MLFHSDLHEVHLSHLSQMMHMTQISVRCVLMFGELTQTSDFVFAVDVVDRTRKKEKRETIVLHQEEDRLRNASQPEKNSG